MSNKEALKHLTDYQLGLLLEGLNTRLKSLQEVQLHNFSDCYLIKRTQGNEGAEEVKNKLKEMKGINKELQDLNDNMSACWAEKQKRKANDRR